MDLNRATIGIAYQPRENAIGFIRMILALIVIIQHSFFLINLSDPLTNLGLMSLGSLGVNGFFILSGFLITSSWMNTKSFVSFTWRRILRIIPAFWICLLVTSFVIGTTIAIVKGIAIDKVFFQEQLAYIYKNIFLIVYQPTISTLTSGNVENSLNGSLWTLSLEFGFYMLLAVAGLFGLLTNRKYFLIAVISIYIFSYWMYDCRCIIFFKYYTSERVAILPFMFAMGMLAYLFKNKIPNSSGLFATCIVLWVLDTKYNHYAPFHPFLLTYIVLWLAVNLPIRSFDRHGDYSYGIYIYHFPIIQLIIIIFNYSINPWLLFLIALAPTGLLAFLSWHYIEKATLSYKNYF